MADDDVIGVFTPNQAQLLWQDYLTRQQLQPQIAKNYPQRRQVSDVSPHRVFIKNAESEVIPPYGCVQITGVEVVGSRTALTVTKPTDVDGSYLFNSQYEIKVVAAGEAGVGWAYRYGVVLALGDVPSEIGEVYQPIVDSWEIEAGGSLFEVYGRHDADSRALIGRFAGGGGGGNLYFGTIDSIDCDAGTLDVEITEVPGACTEPDDAVYGLVTVSDPCDIIGRTSLVYGVELSAMEGSCCIVAKTTRLSDCVEGWRLVDIGGYTECPQS